MAFSLRAGYGSGPHLPSAGDLVGVIEVDDPRGAGGSTCSSPFVSDTKAPPVLIGQNATQRHEPASTCRPCVAQDAS